MVLFEAKKWRWISPGGQFCEKIGSIVVLLGDVMQLNPLEFVLELAHLLAVCHHEGVFVGGLLHDLVNHQLRVTADVVSRSAELDGDAESIDKGLIFHGVV